MNSSNYKYLLLLFLALVFSSCQEDDVDKEPSFDYITSYEFIETITTDMVKARFADEPLISGFINFDVDAYRLTYTTTNYNDSIVEASGLVLIPKVKVEGKVKLTSFQHSTLAKDNDPTIDQEDWAPSYLSSENAEIYLSAMLYASNGYFISAADYIGYGSTKELSHPYEHAATAATTSFDMLRATRELGEELGVETVSGTYLLGYSQGGNSTMALHKYMDENKLTSEFPIKMSAMGAGAYHKTAVGDYIFNFEGDLGFSISLYLWVMDTYDKVYPSLRKGLGYYLNEPYATEVRTKGYFKISSTNPQVIFTEQLIADINDENSAFSQALADNNVHDWKANEPIQLFHSVNDGLVPYFNSTDALSAMQARGSTEIELTSYTFSESVPVGDIHGAGGVKFFGDVIVFTFR